MNIIGRPSNSNNCKFINNKRDQESRQEIFEPTGLLLAAKNP